MRNLAVIAIIITALVLTSCGGSEPVQNPSPSPVPSPPTATVIDAARLFATNCALCHGEKRQGVSGLAPPLTPTSLARLSDDEIKSAILKGRPNTAMASFEGRLNPEEVKALVQLIKYSSP